MQQPRLQCPQVPLESQGDNLAPDSSVAEGGTRAFLVALSLVAFGPAALMTVIFGGVGVVGCGAACVRMRLRVIDSARRKGEEERLRSWGSGRHTT
jgi:hypothetical protein